MYIGGTRKKSSSQRPGTEDNDMVVDLIASKIREVFFWGKYIVLNVYVSGDEQQ